MTSLSVEAELDQLRTANRAHRLMVRALLDAFDAKVAEDDDPRWKAARKLVWDTLRAS